VSGSSPGFLEDRFFTLSVDLLCIAGMDGYFKRLNPAWERTLGFTREELLARPSIEFVHPDDRARSRELAAPLRSGRDVVHFENRYVCKDGSYRWISWAVSAVHEGDVFLYAVGRDITEHRDAEERLKGKTAQLEAVFKALPDLLFQTDASGRIIDYHAGRAADLYVPPETFLGKTFAEVLPRELARDIEAAIERAHRTEQIEAFEYDLSVPSGPQRFEGRVVPVLDGRTILVVRNVTDRWRAQEALKASEERLRESEKLEATGRLAGGIAHDFNNLMMVVLMYSDDLLRKRELSSHHAALLEIRSAGERATNLTGQLLAFARRQILSPSVLDPAVIVRGLEGMLRPVIGEHIRLECDYASGVWSVRADRGQLEQVVMNLALNARDAMPRGGRLRIVLTNTELDDEEARRLDLAPRSQHVRLCVSDTGSGIDAETRAHIFEPFFTTKGVGRGTGLGLATVYGIVRQSGGAVSVETAPGEGASFTVLLPRANDAPGQAIVPERVEPRGTELILIVEDESATRRALAEALRQLGYRTLEAADGEQALATAARHPDIQLLLTDLLMPGLNGYELAARFLVSHPSARVIYMSGYPLVDGGVTGPSAPLLQKPFDSAKLAHAVREALDATVT
jgi:two-component system cell cycle sensor histidine kinase/response regulator CckA